MNVIPFEYDATITRVIDGDTVVADLTATVDLGFQIRSTMATTQTFRLMGIDCPEVHGAARVAGLAAADYTRTRLLGKVVRLHSFKAGAFGKDKYGRWLARIYLDGVDFNAELIAKGYAVAFMEEPVK